MKKLLLLTILGVAALGNTAFAVDGIFPITATIPAATTVGFSVSDVTPPATVGGKPSFAANAGGNALNFNSVGAGMKYLSGPGIWVGDHFFAIDVSPRTAAGVPAPGNYNSISFAYSANVVPAGQSASEGLNKRATLTAVKVTGSGDTATETTLRTGNIGASFAALTNADVAGGFLRVYVGTATGELYPVGHPSAGQPVVPGSVPFTNADKPGIYTGTLTITATLS